MLKQLSSNFFGLNSPRHLLYKTNPNLSYFKLSYVFWNTMIAQVGGLLYIDILRKNSLNTKIYTLFFSIFNTELSFLFCRISVIFRVKSAKAVKITDMDLIKRLGLIVGVFVLFLLIRTLVSPPVVYTGKTDSISFIFEFQVGH